jgi:hypothetical protein
MNDFSQLDALISRLSEVANNAIPIAAEVVNRNIQKRTAEGRDAEEQSFARWSMVQNYSPGQQKFRAGLGLPTSKKTISVTYATMGSLALRNPSGSASPKTGTQLATSSARMPIMVGQMEHPGWRYHHNVLAVNERDKEQIVEAVHLRLQEAAR